MLRSRWVLWQNPEDLTEAQTARLAEIAQTNKTLHRAYLLKEQPREVVTVGGAAGIALLDKWLAWACRCRIGPFVELARKMRRYRTDIANALTHRLTNARVESVNTRIRLITRMAFGFKSVDALLALAMLDLGGYCPPLPGRTHT